jgi:hypothetical protein
VLLVFMADLVLARHRDLESGERRLQHFGIMMAEHTARTFEAVDVLLRETATDLSHSRRDWENWEASRGWEYIAQRHSRAMPQLRDLIILMLGNQRFISTYFPAPRINVRDRPYFAALESGAESATYGPYIGRNSARYTYASPAASPVKAASSTAPCSAPSNRPTCRISAGQTACRTISNRC